MVGVVVLAAAPILVLRFLPMTDFPQHLAVVSILKNMADPLYGYGQYYALDLGRTFYLLPYGLTLLLSGLLPLHLALQCVVFLSALAYPLALMRLLTALGKPRALCLLGLPLIYNSCFYWGFINFNLALGLSLWAMALLCERDRRGRGDVLLAAIGGALVFTHIYGMVLLLCFALLSALLGPRGFVRRNLLALSPVLAGLLLWPWPSRTHMSTDPYFWPALSTRLSHFAREVLGGYQSHAEVPIMLLLAACFGLLLYWRIPIRVARWRGASWPEQALYLLVGVNLLLYFVMPQHTPGAKFVHFRHALLAVALLPPLASAAAPQRLRRLTWGAIVLLAVLSTANAWWHLFKFHGEARAFDRVAREVPARSRLLSLIYDPHGEVMATAPYLHFGAYVQARKGGVLATDFARFWNIPVRLRPRARVPRLPGDFEWVPRKYSFKRFGYYFDHVLVRKNNKYRQLPILRFPYELVIDRSPWQLYRRKKRQ